MASDKSLGPQMESSDISKESGIKLPPISSFTNSRGVIEQQSHWNSSGNEKHSHKILGAENSQSVGNVNVGSSIEPHTASQVQRSNNLHNSGPNSPSSNEPKHSSADSAQKTKVAGSLNSSDATKSNKSKGKHDAVAVGDEPDPKKQKSVQSHFERVISELFPVRKHLGTIVYNPTTTWETLQFENLHGLSKRDMAMLSDKQEEYKKRLEECNTVCSEHFIPMIPPLTAEYSNHFLEVKIAYRHIKEFLERVEQGKVQRKRELWGGQQGLYTDDSDLLSVLYHLGLFGGKLDLRESNEQWKPSDVKRPAVVQKDDDGVDLVDLSVTLLLMPGISEYRGSYKNGINSRSWVGRWPHSGLSMCVYGVKWETVLQSMNERSLAKKLQSEYASDKLCSKELAAQNYGWVYDKELHKELKEKMLRLKEDGGRGESESTK